MDRQEYREKLASKLRGARAESGLAQKQVMAATGISTSHLSRFMNHADLSQWARYVAGTDERVRAALPSVGTSPAPGHQPPAYAAPGPRQSPR